MYVALSQIRIIEKIFFVGNCNPAAIMHGYEKKVIYKPDQLQNSKRTH